MISQCLLPLGELKCFNLLISLIIFCCISLSEEQSASFLAPPPPPPGPPPSDLVEYYVIEAYAKSATAAKSVRFTDQQKPVEDEPETVSTDESSEEESEEEGENEKDVEEANTNDKNLKPPPQPPPPPPSSSLPQIPPPAPPGPPPLLSQTFPPQFGMPPGPPPGPPPRFGSIPRPLMGARIHSGAVVSAPPKSRATDPKSASAVISAQPQLRNMTAEVTKFMPTSVRVRRDQPKASKPKLKLAPIQQVSGRVVGSSSGVQVQGDAYDTFMQEMQGLL